MIGKIGMLKGTIFPIKEVERIWAVWRTKENDTFWSEQQFWNPNGKLESDIRGEFIFINNILHIKIWVSTCVSLLLELENIIEYTNCNTNYNFPTQL